MEIQPKARSVRKYPSHRLLPRARLAAPKEIIWHDTAFCETTSQARSNLDSPNDELPCIGLPRIISSQLYFPPSDGGVSTAVCKETMVCDAWRSSQTRLASARCFKPQVLSQGQQKGLQVDALVNAVVQSLECHGIFFLG
jgi:hypothetical protein